MPDITMCCHNSCTMAEKCYRHPHSGTVSSPFRQSWFSHPDEDLTGDANCRYLITKVVGKGKNEI